MFKLEISTKIKYLLIGLLIANALYFIWSMTLGNTRYSPPPSTKEGVSSIALLPILNTKTDRQSNCYSFGPFNSEKAARQVALQINDFGLATELHKQKTKKTLNYLVYLQAFPSRKEAEKAISDIKEFEIKDYTIIDSGPYKNAISLGSFENIDKARRHAEYVRYLGYDAKYTAHKKPKEVYWVDYDEPSVSHAPVMPWEKEIDSSANVQKIPKACEF